MMLEDPALKLEKKTLPFRLVLEKLREEEREENQRILYVAMTRARDRLYLTGSRDDPVAFLDSKEAGVLGDSTFLDMMPSLDDVTIVELEDLMGEVAVQESLELTDREDSEDFRALVRQRLSYRYPFTEAERIRSRYSVSALNAEAHRPSVSLEEREETEEPDRLAEFHDEPEELPVPLFLAPEHRLTGAERGTIYHRIMEYIDFPEVAEKGREALTEAMERMVVEEILLPVEVESVEPERILAFFQTPLGKRCVAAARRGELFREESFVLAMEREGEQTGVQGVIDVFFREEGHLVLLDYKTNRIDPELPQEQEDERIAAMYRKQQALYAQALEKASGKDVAEAWLYLFQADRPVLLAL
jgi:ATP-dependent helicase/nuclease subunit A